MFIRQDGKLYVKVSEKKIIGVEIYPDNVKRVEGTEVTLNKNHEEFSATDIWVKYNIREDNPYIFPVEKKVEKKEDVSEGGTTKSTKKSTRKSRSK